MALRCLDWLDGQKTCCILFFARICLAGVCHVHSGYMLYNWLISLETMDVNSQRRSHVSRIRPISLENLLL